MKVIACALSAALILSLCAFAVPASPKAAAVSYPRAQDLVTPVSSQIVPTRSQDPELSKHLRKYDLLKINPATASREVQNRGRLVLKSSHGDFDLKFSPYDLRAPDYYAQEIGADGMARRLPNAPVNTFKASVEGDPRAQARMSLGANGLEGAIITTTEKYFLQPARALSKNAQADEFVFYSAADVEETDATCGVTLAEEIAAREELVAANAELDATSELNNPITPLSPMKIARIATDADAEFVNGLGGQSAAQQQILQTMNVVDGIYQVEIGVMFQISFQNFWSDQTTDPYTTLDASALLTEFRNYWNANFTQTRSVAHLWTGKDLTGSTIGIAFLSVVCRNPGGAYGLSQRFPLAGSPDARTAILTAHELGHNFSAQHTNVVTKDVPPEFSISCDNTIMESGLGSRTGSSFCAFSRSQMVGHTFGFGSCLLDSSTPPPSSSCVETPITPGVTTNGSITSADCASPSRGVPNFADRYTFDATAGQQITIAMNQTSGTVNPYLYLIGPDGYMIDQAEFGSTGTNARIPEVSSSTGFFTLPHTGRYIIEATSSLPGQTGDYQLTLSFNGCVLSASTSAQQFPASGGNATLNVTVFGPCGSYNVGADPATGGSTWILLSSGAGAGTLNFNVTVPANSNALGRRSFILIGSSGISGDTGGLRIPITQAGTGAECSVTPIFVGQTINGQLTSGDCESPVRGAGLRTDRYTFFASAGQVIGVSLFAGTLSDPFLTLIGPTGAVILTDDDGGGGSSARIPGGNGLLTLGLSGTYTIEASSLSANQLGTYSLLLTGLEVAWHPTILEAGQVEFRSWSFEGRTYVYVKLTFFPSAQYRVNNWGTPVQTGNDFSVDAIVERFNDPAAAFSNTAQIYDLGPLPAGNYTFAFKNSGTTVKSLNFSVSATAPPPNPIDDAREFVRWQYKDFLRREPDGPGWDHWTGEITECSDPAKRFPNESEPQCIERKRANTSAAFFLSPEFQNTGYFVLRVYRGSLGRMPHFGGTNTTNDEFTRDAATVSQGIVVNDKLAPDVINANKQAFVNEFVTRQEFRAIYDGLKSTEYVNKLFATTGVTPSVSDRQALIDGLNSGTETRASVLFKVVDGTTTVTDGHLIFNTLYGRAFYDNLFNAAFVQMEYFGYLLRDPDEAGYAFWLGKLNQFGNWVDAQMVLAFIKSPEYRSRFGQP